MRTVLLDLDGTLADSAALIGEHLAAALAAVGAPVPGPRELRALVGPPFETALPALGLTAVQTAAVITHYRHSYDRVAAAQTRLFPGIAGTLDRLAAAGLRLAVATSKPERTARRIVAGTGVGERFALVAGADRSAGRVGKAAVVGSVLARLAVDPVSTPVVMVGDRCHDVEGAARHGVPTIGVAWGYAEPGELAGARVVAQDVAQLLDLLTGDAPVWSAGATAAAS